MYSYSQLQEIIDSEIKNLPLDKAPDELYEPVRYILSIGGKRIRPVLVLMACNLFSEDISMAIKPALGMEIFHNFTLLHDDVMDNASLRRNQPTVHTRYNENIAILAGDAMLIIAYDYFFDCKDKILKEVLKTFNLTALQICEGQQYDMNYEGSVNVTIDEYLNMIELKTSVLIGSSLKIGALIGGADKKDIQLLYDVGKNIGMGFQLQDDFLDVYGDEKVFGKNIGGDIVSNKKTYLLIKALELAGGKTYENLMDQLDRKEFLPEKKITAVKAVYDELKVMEHTKEKMSEYFNSALNILGKIEVEENKKEELKQVIRELLVRVY